MSIRCEMVVGQKHDKHSVRLDGQLRLGHAISAVVGNEQRRDPQPRHGWVIVERGMEVLGQGCSLRCARVVLELNGDR